MKIYTKITMILVLTSLFTGCVTTGDKQGTEIQGAETDKRMNAKDALYAAVKLLPSYLDELPDFNLDAYIKNEEHSVLNPFKTPSNEFERAAHKEKRKQVREKIKRKAQVFNLDTEYKYVYKGGVTLGAYDFDKKSFPIKELGNFYINFPSTHRRTAFPDNVYIQFPKDFNDALPIDEKKGENLVERSMRRDHSQHRKVFPVITYKLVDVKPKNEERLKAASQSYQDTSGRIRDMDRMMNNALVAGGLPSQGPSSYNLNKADKQKKLRTIDAGMYIRAVVTSITIYRRPNNIWINTTLLNKNFQGL